MVKMNAPRVIIYKASRQLVVFDAQAEMARMPIALGREPIGPKQNEGDGKTPEGVFYACVRNNQSKYHLSIGLSYPSLADAQRGLAEGIISREQYDAIVSAIGAGKRPPWDTGLGGEIMIHGGGTASDWTVGCIAVDDSDMDFLWEHIGLGTEVQIVP